MTADELDRAGREIAPAAESVRRSMGSSGLLKPFVTLRELQTQCANDELLQEVLESAIEYCIRYTLTICRYRQAYEGGVIDAEKLAELEQVRKPIHDATIDSINALSRVLKRSGKSNDWIQNISGNRAAYAKLALLLGFERMESYMERRAV